MLKIIRQTLLLSIVSVLMVTCFYATPALALTQIQLTNTSYKECPPELAKGSVTSGDITPANCFLITGTAINPTGKTVFDADVFGRIYDANNDTVMPNRTRIGNLEEIPPGESPFEFRISVPANQPTPLKLEKLKAAGFARQVRQ